MAVTGKWQVTIETAAGPREATLSLELDGDVLAGEMRDQAGPTEVQGTADGDALEFVATTPGMSGPIEMTFDGRVEGDRISGSVDFGDHGAGMWSGTRA